MSKGRIVTWVAPRGWVAAFAWLASRSGAAFALAAATLALWGYLGWLRRLFEHGGWSPTGFWPPGFDPYALGLAVQEWTVPAALVGLLTLWPAFRRTALGQGGFADRARAALALAGVQLVYFAYLWALERRDVGHLTLGELGAALGGLLLGPGWGLALGAFTGLAASLLNLVTWPPEPTTWGDVARWYVLYTSHFAALIWLGVAAGLLGRAVRGGVGLWALGGGGLVLASRFFVLLGEAAPEEGAALMLPLGLAAAGLLGGLGLLLQALRLQEAERRARAGELALTQAELAALRAQINPHFLFNALNTIRYFVRTDPDQARALLLRLSEVFQRVLRSGPLVPLADELAYTEAYLALEQARLGDRLRVEWTRPEGPLLELQVPALILEPLVENAVVHGLAARPEGGTLRILVERWGRELVIQVRDDGVGFDPASRDPNAGSIALANIDARLRLLYGEDRGLRIESEPGRGTRVELRLPLPAGWAEAGA
ncbi:sensor histidine kinase [Oceanithermus profundus]